MLSLIIVLLIVVRIAYCIKRKKGIFASEGFLMLLLSLVVPLGGMLGFYLGIMATSESIPKYQEENRIIEAQMKELKDGFYNGILENPEQSKENFEVMCDEFIEEYSELKEEFEENNEVINQYNQMNLSRIKFLLFFGH